MFIGIYVQQISGERLQDHWSSGLTFCTENVWQIELDSNAYAKTLQVTLKRYFSLILILSVVLLAECCA